MKLFSIAALMAGAAGLALVSLGTAAHAEPGDSKPTPKSWNYEIKDGKRVPKGQRKVNADGSWREEIRVGKCITIKEKSAAGEYKESRRCD